MRSAQGCKNCVDQLESALDRTVVHPPTSAPAKNVTCQLENFNGCWAMSGGASSVLFKRRRSHDSHSTNAGPAPGETRRFWPEPNRCLHRVSSLGASLAGV